MPTMLPDPTSPTSSLPPLTRLSTTSTFQISSALTNLRSLYWPPPPPPLPKDITIPKRILPEHNPITTSVVDSGYASADEDINEDNDTEEIWKEPNWNPTAETALEILRADPFERAFAIKWITGFISRYDLWVGSFDGDGGDEDDESFMEGDTETRMKLLDDATEMLSAFTATEGEEESSLARTFQFSCSTYGNEGTEDSGGGIFKVELNDGPVSTDDHTSVGLQSWGSSILLAERIAFSPSDFSFPVALSSHHDNKPYRILELGAGTGLLSIVSAKILSKINPRPTIIATDYHPDVLENLTKNVQTNFSCSSPPSSLLANNSPPVIVKHLDWEHPQYDKPLDERFDLILGADVIYHPNHALWIKHCVETMLRLPSNHQNGDTTGRDIQGGFFWLMIPIRTGGRHEGLYATVEALFPSFSSDVDNNHNHEPKLVILEEQVIGKKRGIGRGNEGEYRLFKIGWV